MYVSYQIQRMHAAETMTKAEQRQVDDQLGRLAADVSWQSRRLTRLARALSPAGTRGPAIGPISKETRRSPALNCTTTRQFCRDLAD